MTYEECVNCLPDKLKRLKFNYTEALKRYNKINAYLNFPRTSMTKSNKLRTQIIE